MERSVSTGEHSRTAWENTYQAGRRKLSIGNTISPKVWRRNDCGRHPGEAVKRREQKLIDKMGRTLADVAAAFLLLALIVAGMPVSAFAEHNAPVALADRAVLFPLSVAPSKSYLQDAAGRPFLIHGDAAWSLIAGLTREKAELYLADRRARGFNTVAVNLIEHRFLKNPPANAYGESPFTVPWDFTTPNEAYFEHADWVLRRASELGFLVLLAPAFLGYEGGNQGWYREMLTFLGYERDQGWYREMMRSGPDKLHAYGRFLGKRYSSFKNIIWVQAGDFDPPDKRVVNAIAEGIVETAPGALQTAHCAPETAALDYWAGEPWLTLNNVYTYERVQSAVSKQYGRTGQMPFILIESAYENEHGATDQRLRMQAYDALLSGAAGQVFGNNPVWHFDGPGLFPAPVDWELALASPGAESMRHLIELMESVAWWTLKPSQRLVVNDHAGLERAVGARAKDGSFAIIYLPGLRGIRVDLAELAGKRVTANWFDPAIGSSISAGADLSPSGTHVFQPPGVNGGGSKDWVLLLRSRS
jgi:hypothetical protein